MNEHTAAPQQPPSGVRVLVGVHSQDRGIPVWSVPDIQRTAATSGGGGGGDRSRSGHHGSSGSFERGERDRSCERLEHPTFMTRMKCARLRTCEKVVFYPSLAAAVGFFLADLVSG